jgi:hypothetical protein
VKLLEQARHVLRIQRFARPGHADVSTTMIYTHALSNGVAGVRSPLDLPPPSSTR